ncbi:MAG: hypothetical protein COB26_04355 [Piscirickettsiaceae bacterium]|nr:MAG: hypothetical protein COB89_04115 [Piscirickettsiaceae bacterium]PCI70225.1 MAG: hypothetical protein COB26_04355 [Piscirickettsiaceae bacterium]
MLKHYSKTLIIIASCLTLLACHKPPVLDNALTLSILNDPEHLSGYTVSMVTNNPTAHGNHASGWTCADKKTIIDAGLAVCKTSGRSGVYLKFTDEGKRLLVGNTWGNSTTRNARVTAVIQQVQDINDISMVDKTHAIVSFNSAYVKHTAFSNTQLKSLIPLNVPKTGQANFVLIDKQWRIE